MLRMSICSGSARLPIFNISAANPASAFILRKPSATSAPACANASEMARPNPRAAPVTSATCPFNVNCGYSMTLLRRLPFIPTHRLTERPSIRDSTVPPSHINPTILSRRDGTSQPRNTTMMGRASYRVFILAIPWRDDNAHTMHQTRGIFVLCVPLFLATEHFFLRNRVGYCRSVAVTWEMTHEGGQVPCFGCEEAGHLPISERSVSPFPTILGH